MKHSQVKGKTIQMVRTQIKGKTYEDHLIETHRKQLQPLYYDQKNHVQSDVKGDELTHRIKNAIFYTMKNEKLPSIVKVNGKHSTEYIEQINRTKHVVDEVVIKFKIDRSVEDKVEFRVTFRKGGDFILERKGYEPIFGSKLKASDFNEKGFQTTNAYGVTNIYVAI